MAYGLKHMAVNVWQPMEVFMIKIQILGMG